MRVRAYILTLIAVCVSVSARGASEPALLDRVIELNRVQEPELDPAAMHKAFAELCEKAHAALKSASTPRLQIAALSTVLLQQRDVSYLSNKYWRDATLAASLLRRKGNCLSTSTLFVLVGDELKLPLHLVLAPQHAFVRWDDGTTRINIETTSKGVELPDVYYLYRQGHASPEDVDALGWGKSLDRDGFLAELLLVTANFCQGEHKLADAVRYLQQVEKLEPQRVDIKLQTTLVEGELSHDRPAMLKSVAALLQTPNLPPSVSTSALCWLAAQSAAEGKYEQERTLLLTAFSRAPKSEELSILQSLAHCYRSLRDPHGALRYMELATALMPQNSPEFPNVLYNLAIYQKEDNRLPDALATIRSALKLNPESWKLQVSEAGYMVLSGQRDEGIKRFEKVETPKGEADAWEAMRAWFFAVSQQRDKFFTQLAHCLEQTSSPAIFIWLDQEPDLNAYRSAPEFNTLVAKHRTRLGLTR